MFSPGDRGADTPLLSKTDLPPAHIINARGLSPFLLIGDHAGAKLPSALGTLGLSAQELRQHIALDIGVQAVGEALSAQLDATFICQRYSRLVVDSNRSPRAFDAMPATSDGTTLPGNASLTPADRERRIAEIHTPYQQAIARHLDGRDKSGTETVLISLHSFTPVMAGFERPWHIGVLHNGGDNNFATALLDRLRQEDDLVVGDNEPYRMDWTDFTVPLHAFPMRRPYAEIEIRQDLIAGDDGVAVWSERLARTLNWSLRASRHSH